jgi:hypothetical protein
MTMARRCADPELLLEQARAGNAESRGLLRDPNRNHLKLSPVEGLA